MIIVGLGVHPVNENELIDAAAKDSGLARADAAKAVDAVVTTVTKTLKKGEDVAISGFGKFSVIRRGARAGRNPATGAALKIRASKAPQFTAGAALEATVSGEKKT